jgi:hypothetical protein
MSALGSFLYQSLGGGGSVHDYAHASQIFRTNNFARAPKFKWLFQLNFILNPEASGFVNTREISYMVKSVELPKFTFEIKDMNQYNRHVTTQTRLKYEPITIKFHDDNYNQVRDMWNNYYGFYVREANYTSQQFNLDDKYVGGIGFEAWGLDVGGVSSQYFNSLEIYSLHGGTSNKITLMNPTIISFSHDTHDYSQTNEVMEMTMQVRYTGVIYEQGYAAGINGFADPSAYDTNISDLTGGYAGYVMDPNTGQLVQATDQFNPFSRPTSPAASQLAYYNYNPTQPGLSPVEINSLLSNQNPQLNQFSFPTANIRAPTYSQNYTEYAPANPLAYSNNQFVPDANSANGPFPPQSWQGALFNKGYSVQEINSAESYVNSLSSTPDNPQLTAELYLSDANQMVPGTVTYGQNTSYQSNINFSDPTNSVNPTYNSLDWKAQLSAMGYSDGDIKIASDNLSQINIAPGTDLVPLAISQIQNYKAAAY